MKIRDRVAEQEAAKVQQQQATTSRISKGNKSAQAEQVIADRATRAGSLLDTEQVNIGLASLIRKELDPTVMEEERKKKLEELKARIASGEYKPSSRDVAESFIKEVVMEGLTTPGFADDDDDTGKTGKKS